MEYSMEFKNNKSYPCDTGALSLTWSNSSDYYLTDVSNRILDYCNKKRGLVRQGSIF